MAVVQDCETAFAEPAASDGIALAAQTFEWASEPGHLAVADLADETGDPGVMQRAEIGVAAIDGDGAAAYERAKDDLPSRLRG